MDLVIQIVCAVWVAGIFSSLWRASRDFDVRRER